MADNLAMTSPLTLKYPQRVAEYATYEAAQQAVDFLADRQFADLMLWQQITSPLQQLKKRSKNRYYSLTVL